MERKREEMVVRKIEKDRHNGRWERRGTTSRVK